jgi:DNA-binding CsgD family transcriptional regulator
MSLDERILSVIEALYEAALDETLWSQALTALTSITGSQAATFWVLDGSGQPRLPTLTSLNFDPAFIAEYQNGMVPMDPTVRYLVAHPDQPIVHDGLVISERDKEHHAYYDWHGRHSDTRYRLVGQARPAQEVQAGVALHRTRRIGRYEPGDIDQFALLHRHLERALVIAFRLGTLGTMQQCTTELLDRNPAAVLLLDERQRVVYMNRSAAALQSTGDGIRISPRGLVLPGKRNNDDLQGLMTRAIATGTSKSSAGGTMSAVRPSGKRPYGILVTPVSRRYPALSTLRPAVCVVITDPDQPRSLLPASRLRAVFGLTDGEARLAARLVAGDDLRMAAARLGITYGTARARLAEIFQKTDTHRQAQLISLLLTITAVD